VTSARAPAAVAVQRASQILLARQDNQGWWPARSASDVLLEAEALLVAQVLGTRAAERTNVIAQQIRSLQQADGRWTGNGGSPAEGDGPAAAGDLSASVLAYLALRLAGDSTDAYHMAVAAGWIRDAGGLAAVGVLARTWLAVFGLAAWSDVPVPAPERCYLSGRQLPSRPAAVTLAIIGTLRPVRPVPIQLTELRVGEDCEQTEQRPRRFAPAPTAAHTAALRKCGQWLVGWQHRSGLPPARRPTWPLSLVALHLLGYPLDHPVLAKGLAWLTAVTAQPRQPPGPPRPAPVRQPPVLDTTMAVEALAAAGLPPDHPALVAAARWLLLQRIEGPSMPALAGAIEPSGWSFGRDGYPALTDTARVLLALRQIRLPGLTGRPAIRSAIRWLISMQARDGSWSGSPVVTAHVVRALAAHAAADVRAIRRGVVWLLRQQLPAGSWPGPDGELAATATVLPALIVAGVLPAKPPIRSAAAWLLGRQNSDGGWAWAAQTAGSQTQATGRTLAALLTASTDTAGGEMPDAIDRAAGWLVHAQQPDGGWRDEASPGGRSPARRRAALLPGLLVPLAALGRYAAIEDRGAATQTDSIRTDSVPVG
jgi:squalene-hopene/tetraprenyl-beta-curcumene cyclase